MDPIIQQQQQQQQHQHQRNDPHYYNQQNYSENELFNNMNSLSLSNNNNNTPSAGATFLATSTRILGYNNPTPPRSSPLPRPKSSAAVGTAEEWKKSSSSSSHKEGWKTSSNSGSPKKKKEIESWKMSAKPRHAQLASVQQETDRRHSAPVISTQPVHWPKPLPQEPYIYPTPIIQPQQQQIEYNNCTPYLDQSQQPFHIATTSAPFINHQRPITYPTAYNEQPYPPIQQAPYTNYPPQPHQNDYPTPFIHNEYPTYNEHPPLDYHPIPTAAPYNNEYPPVIEHHQSTTLSDPPVNNSPIAAPVIANTATDEKKKKDTKDTKPEKKVRQITVQSINVEHRVWIDVLPAETGLSLAEKIHIIATFRTRKIVSITTASGRKIPLDNRPVFGSWMDMESFEDGERWTVEWRENDRGVVDKFMSKIIQAGGGKRTKDHVA